MKLSKKNLLHRKKKRKWYKTQQDEKIEETLSWYDEEIEKNPKDTGLYFAKASLLAQQGKYTETLEVLNRIIELDSDNERVWLLKAKTLYELKRYEEALQSYDMILHFDVTDERVWYHRGEAFSKLGMYKEAMECYDKAIDIDRNFTEAWLGRGNALRKIRYEDHIDISDDTEEASEEILEDALESYTKVTEHSPDNVEALHGKGNVYLELDRLEEALGCFDKSLKIEPDHLQSWYDRGLVEQRLGRDEDAIGSFETAINHYSKDKDNNDYNDWNAVANSYYKLGRYKESLSFYDDIGKEHPSDYHLQEGIGRLLERLGKNKEAILHYTKAVELNPNTAYSRVRIGNLLSDSGELSAAITNYNEAVSLEPELEQAWYMLAELMTQQNKFGKAKDCYKWILEISPNSGKARSALSYLESQVIPEIAPPRGPMSMVEPGNLPADSSEWSMEVNDLLGLEKELLYEDSLIQNDIINENVVQKATPYNEPSFDNIFWPQQHRKKSYSISEEVKKGIDKLQKYIHNTADQLESFIRGNWINADEKLKAETLFIKGKEFYDKGKYDEALDCLDSALKLNPHYLDIWSVKGDVLLELGRIEEAQACYKHAAFSILRPSNDVMKIKTNYNDKKENGWLKSIVSLIGDKGDDLQENSRPLINCPNCEYRFDLVEKQCPFCLIFIPEEDFKNDIIPMEDDLVFFEILNHTLENRGYVYIHLDGANGLIKYLDTRENVTSGELEYVMVRGEIEKLCWDYSFKDQ